MAKAFFDMTPQDVIDEVTKSGLRGRGGAGFPAGKKWGQVAFTRKKPQDMWCVMATRATQEHLWTVP